MSTWRELKGYNIIKICFACATITLLIATTLSAQDVDLEVDIHWNKTTGMSKTTPTLQVVVNPMLRRDSAIHDNAFKALHDLQADYVRYVPWLPYPRLGVAELYPPKDNQTFFFYLLQIEI